MPTLANHRHIVWVLALALLTLGLLTTGCSNGNASPAGAKAEVKQIPILVQTLTAVAQTKDVQRRYSGYTHPWDTHGVGFLVGGRVTSIRVKQGDVVTKGQLLATLDASDYMLMKQLAETQVQAIEPNYHRVQKLVKNKVLPQSELDVLEGRYNAAKTQRDQAERQIRYTRLLAPVAGVVHELRTAVGQVIGQGSPAIVLLQVDKLKAKFGVSQQELAAFTIGKTFTVSVPGVADAIEGTVIHIDYVADPTTRTYNVSIEIENPKHLLRPGMMAQIHIVKESRTGFFVPISSVIKDSKGRSIIKLVDPQSKKVSARPVTTGQRWDEELQILDGLTGGESVITSGSTLVTVGDTVEIQ